MAEGTENGRINVSEDRLRGVLAEFELRLRDFIEKKLEHKADQVALDALTVKHEKHGERINKLEQAHDRQTAVSQWWHARWVVVAAVLSSVWWLPDLIHRYIHHP